MLRKIIKQLLANKEKKPNETLKPEVEDNITETPNNTVKEDNISFDEIRSLSKKQIELFEHWSRRLIDDQFRKDYGNNYINVEVSNGQPLVKAEIKKRITDRMKSNPGRFPRQIDAILLEDIEYFFSRSDLFEKYFKKILEPYCACPYDIRLILDRLIAIRNKLSHDNPISIREAEQVLCYTNDFIDVYKEYFIKVGKEKEFNVPVFLSLSDSQGNRVYRKDTSYYWEVRNTTKDNKENNLDFYAEYIVTHHRSGEHYSIEFEVDSSFPENLYSVEWIVEANYHKILSGKGKMIDIYFTDEIVSFEPVLKIFLTTNKTWHRFASDKCDDCVVVHLNKVLPPIEDTY